MSFAYIKDYRGFYLHWDAWKAFIPHLAQAQNDYQIHYSGRWPFHSHLLLSVTYTEANLFVHATATVNIYHGIGHCSKG